MIKETTDYEIFKKCVHNRPLYRNNIEKIKKSILIKNLLLYRPILVNRKMEILDGQHRLEAAKELVIPIFYEIQNEMDVNDIILLNDNSKHWSYDDYLNFYVQQGNKEYIKLKSFLDKYEINLSTALVILGKSRSGGNSQKHFKKGGFEFPDKLEEENSVKILNQSVEIIQYIIPKVEGNTKYLKGPAFRRALYVFLSIQVVDFDTFMNKIKQRLDLIRPCARIKDFVSIFKQIYNFKNRNPITLDEYE